MKKLLVLSVLLGLMALPMFASDITFGGDATYGFITNFSGDATGNGEKTDLTFDVKAKIDDFSSLTINMDGLEFNVLAAKGGDLTKTLEISKALVTTDLGKWLGLPLGLKVMWGYDDPDANEFHSTSYYANEEMYNFSPDEYWGFALLASYKFLEFEFAINPGVVGTDVGYLLAGVAAKEPIPGMNAEFYYFQNKRALDEYGEGRIMVDASYKTEVSGFTIDVGAGFGYDMLDTAANAWAWGAGLAVDYSKFHVDFGFDGNETDVFQEMTAWITAALVEKATLFAGLQFDFADTAAETFQGVELGVIAKVGAVTTYIGYLVNNDAFGGFESPAQPADGGFFIKWDVNY